MGDLIRLNLYFSVMAFVVSAVICVVKGITLPGALMRVFLAAAAFYILGSLISAVLIRDVGEKPRDEDSPVLMPNTDEEFEEIEFPVVDLKEKDIPNRG